MYIKALRAERRVRTQESLCTGKYFAHPNRLCLYTLAILLMLGLLPVLYAVRELPASPAPHATGLFAWSDAALRPDGRETLLARMASEGIGEVYQYVSSSASTEDAAALAAVGAEYGIRVFLLAGEPEWALDREGMRLLRELTRAKTFGFAGLVVDVEPYLTTEWEEERAAVLERFTEALRRLKRAAKKTGMEIVLCIPYYWDEQLESKQLERLVAEGCDTLAVMNYYRRHEAQHLAGEAALCAKHRKALINIYELQSPGKHGISEENTYYGAGLEALRESWRVLRQEYPDLPFSCALHELESWEELLDRE